MSSTNAPFGMRAAYSPSGIIRPVASTITSGYDTNIYTGQPVKIGSNGTIEVAAAGERLIGAFAGCQYLPTGAQRPVISPSWPANVGATEIIAYYTSDPYIVYEIQADGQITQAEVGQQADFTNVANSNGLGYSTCTMDAATSASTAAQLRVVGIANAINNTAGDAYTIVQVQIAQHQYVSTENPF
jgi:hypothetical protein